MTTMQLRIAHSCRGTKENRESVRRVRDEVLSAAARGQPIPLPVENELYVLRADGRTVRVQVE